MGCTPISRKKKSKIFTICPIRFIRENASKILQMYSLDSMVGEGTYGKVYLSIHKTTQQPRAIKIISKRAIPDTKQRYKFMNEISVLKVIDHPNIIKLYDFFEDDRNYYLVSDYLSGGGLLDFIIKNKVCSEKLSANYIKQVLETVAYLHSKNIVHRDIKLENLMLESADPDAMVKLIDFGTSVIGNPLKKMKNRKSAIFYLAPEVLRNTYNEKCDL